MGNFAYITVRNFSAVAALDLGGLLTPTAEIGNLVSNDIETNFLRVTQALVADSLNINTNGLIGGSLSITGTASSTLIDSNQNVALSIESGFLDIGTTTATSGIRIGYGAICVDNDGECSATTTGRISSVSTYSGNSDLAETYFSSDPLEPGDIVQLEESLSVTQATKESTNTIIGVVSTKPGVLLGFDDVSTNEGEQQYPIGLKGRIPVKVSTENGPIEPGDQLMLSSIPGTAMKAAGTGAVVGIALEAFNPQPNDPYYSDTFINQYTDDIPSTEDVDAIIEELEDTPLETEVIPATSTEALTDTTSSNDTTDVSVGQIVMFVDLSYRYLDDETSQALTTLMGTTTEDHQGDNEDETILDRLRTLAEGFVGGVLSIFSVEAERVELADELCLNGTCIEGGDLQVLIDSLDDMTQITVIDDESEDDVSVDIDTPTEPVSTTTTNTGTTTDSGETGENTASSTEEIGDNGSTASSTDAGGVENGSASSTSTVTEETDESETADAPVSADPDVPDQTSGEEVSLGEGSSTTQTEDTSSVSEVENEPEDVVESESLVEEEPVSQSEATATDSGAGNEVNTEEN